MQMFSAHVEISKRDPDPTYLEDLVEDLVDYSPAAGVSARGWVDLRISVPATSLAQATRTALATVEASIAMSGVQVVALQVMTEDEFNAREGFEPVPELIGATEASALLGVSRQRVAQMAHEGKLPGQTIGKSLVFPRAAVVAAAAKLYPKAGAGDKA